MPASGICGYGAELLFPEFMRAAVVGEKDAGESLADLVAIVLVSAAEPLDETVYRFERELAFQLAVVGQASLRSDVEETGAPSLASTQASRSARPYVGIRPK